MAESVLLLSSMLIRPPLVVAVLLQKSTGRKIRTGRDQTDFRD
jgi:hypothetical protein